jgi:EAL domain-containing protein (putative c-di-GMP-specific phosphodiesterase class I)/CheY-like chemotaxis protein
MMDYAQVENAFATFGRRKVVPRACIADGKPHIRNFLREALEDLGFVTCECDDADALRSVVSEQRPDLFVLGLSAGGLAANAMLEEMQAMAFAGHILLFGPPASPMTTAILAIGRQNGLAMLPLLPTPFSDQDLRARIAPLLPEDGPPIAPVDAAEAIHANWLELWYQPKIEVRSLTLVGAEAQMRLRHPNWGTFPPASFLTDDADPHFSTLSEYVTARAVKDWLYFVGEYGHVEIAVNLPVAFFQHPEAIGTLARQMPNHPAFEGLIIQINGRELLQNRGLAKQAARQLQIHNIGVAVDDLGAEWPLLLELNDFPFVEIKVDRNFVTGCAENRLKQSTCRRILELADGFGARTVAAGVETRSDFLVARELGFDLLQGFFFAKPMEPQKFAHRVLRKPVTVT